jgi:hypothetical protein
MLPALKTAQTKEYQHQPLKRGPMKVALCSLINRWMMPLLRKGCLNSHPCQAKSSKEIIIQVLIIIKQLLRVMQI